jgi:hypothetical protein
MSVLFEKRIRNFSHDKNDSSKSTPNEKSLKTIDFLLADFADTSEHLKVTGRKIEFTFQIFLGFFSVLGTIIITLMNTGSGNSLHDLISDKLLLCQTLFVIFLFLSGLTLWVFEYILRGRMMSDLYKNRMNYLRLQIYELLQTKINDLDKFAYVEKLSSTSKVGMTDLFLTALQIGLSFFVLPSTLGCLVYYFNLDSYIGLSDSFPLAVIYVYLYLVFSSGVYFLIGKHRNKLVLETEEKNDKFWKKIEPKR